jgi:hypothetical protein
MLTEEQIEAAVERCVDYLDRVFMKGLMSQKDYDANMRELNEWAEGKRTESERQELYRRLWGHMKRG